MADEAIKRLVELGINATPAVEELQRLRAESEKQSSALQKMQDQMSAFGKTVGIGAALTFAWDAAKQVVGAIQDVIDSMDDLGKRAQGLGVGVEQLQELGYAADLAGVSQEELGRGLTQLVSKMADVDKGTDKASRMLRELGVTAKDDTYAALTKVAAGFAKAQDGATKTQWAVELFGAKLATKMIPLLNSGEEGLRQAAQEAHSFGLVVDQEATKAAEEFNDNVTRLKTTLHVGFMQAVKDLLPWLAALSKQLLQNARDFGIMEGAALTLMEQVFGKEKTLWAQQADAAEKEAARIAESLKKMTPEQLRGEGFLAGTAKLAVQSMQQYLNKAEEARAKIRAWDQQEAAAAAARWRPPGSGTQLKTMADDTGKGAQKAAKETKVLANELQQAALSMSKMHTQTQAMPEVTALWRAELERLTAAGEGNTAWAQKVREELQKLDPDPVVAALKQLQDAAKQMERTPDVIAGVTAKMDELQRAGLEGTATWKLYAEALNKLKTQSGDPFAVALSNVERLAQEQERNNQQLDIFNQLLDQGAISVDQYNKLTAGLYATGTAIADNTEKVKELDVAVAEMSARFIGDFVDKLIDGFGKAEQSFGEMIESFLKQLAKLLASEQLQEFYKLLSTSAKSSGGWGSMLASWFSAQGNAWQGPGVQAMATGGILTSPTFFRNGPRMAVAGEAGPEAVVPLQRTASGALGVGASPVEINVYDRTGSEVTAQQSTTEDGTRQIDIYIERKVRSMFTTGSMDRTMRAAYGVSRQPTAG